MHRQVFEDPTEPAETYSNIAYHITVTAVPVLGGFELILTVGCRLSTKSLELRRA